MDYVQINRTVRDSIKKNVIFEMYMGSHAHNMADEHSDADIICIYVDPDCGKNIHNETNGYQYKINNTDENYQELRTFVRNVINGRNPPDFEAVIGLVITPSTNIDHDSVMFISSLLHRLAEIRSYSLIKSYTGYAKKDAKHAVDMLDSGCDLNTRALCKKLAHLYRGNLTIKYLLGLESNYLFNDMTYNKEYRNIAMDIKNGIYFNSVDSVRTFITEQQKLTKEYRELAVHYVEVDKIPRKARLNTLRAIDTRLRQLLESLGEIATINYGDIRYQVIEFGADFQYKK